MQNPNPKKNFVAYGCSSSLKLLGSFRADLQVGLKSELTTLHVINGPANTSVKKLDLRALRSNKENIVFVKWLNWEGSAKVIYSVLNC